MMCVTTRGFVFCRKETRDLFETPQSVALFKEISAGDSEDEAIVVNKTWSKRVTSFLIALASSILGAWVWSQQNGGYTSILRALCAEVIISHVLFATVTSTGLRAIESGANMYKCKYRQLQRLARQVEVGKLSLDTEPDLIAWYEARRACLHNPVTFFPLLIFRFAICFIAVSLLGCAVTWLARLPDLADGETPAKSILKDYSSIFVIVHASLAMLYLIHGVYTGWKLEVLRASHVRMLQRASFQAAKKQSCSTKVSSTGHLFYSIQELLLAEQPLGICGISFQRFGALVMGLPMTCVSYVYTLLRTQNLRKMTLGAAQCHRS